VRFARIGAGRALLASFSLAALALAPAASVAAASGGPLGQFKHLVVIYEENHSFDNLYGLWGAVNGEPVEGLPQADTAHTTQVDQAGSPYDCLLMSDVNFMSPPLSPDCSSSTFTFSGTNAPTTAYHYSNEPFLIDEHIPADAATCPAITELFAHTFGILNGAGLPGGCTRDLVHRFYHEQYQIDGGNQDRYATGSDSAGMTMGHYDTTQLPIYDYLHANGAPHYVIADRFFQGAFGGSFLNHQYLIAAQPPVFVGATVGQHSVLDANGFPNKTYPLYTPTTTSVVDGPVTQACGLTSTVAGFACGDFAVNTSQPFFQPTSAGANLMQPINDVDPTAPNFETNIGDELSDTGVSWAWYAGGWDNATGNIDGRGWTGTATACAANSTPAVKDGAGNGGFPYCPDRSFQFHHQPFDYFASYAPATTDRAQHLLDEQDFLHSVAAGSLPSVSFVKPLGLENEHPGYASESNGSDHLVDLIKAVESGPQAGNTLIVVTYDEFGGQWDHVSPPAGGTGADEFGPGTRVPAILIGRSLTTSTVDHTVYDTTSIIATIEHQWHLAPVGNFTAGGVTIPARDGLVSDLGPAISAGRRGH
jgi:acid phosphatase